MNLLTTLVEKYDAQIVISSTWRILVKDSYAFKQLFKVAGYRTIANALHKDYMTDKEGNIRGEEIQRWLDAHPECDNYLILDDDCDMVPSQEEHFVNTSVKDGILLEHFIKAEEILAKGC